MAVETSIMVCFDKCNGYIDADRVLILDIGNDSLVQEASNLLIKHGLLEEIEWTMLLCQNFVVPCVVDKSSISWSFVEDVGYEMPQHH